MGSGSRTAAPLKVEDANKLGTREEGRGTGGLGVCSYSKRFVKITLDYRNDSHPFSKCSPSAVEKQLL